MSTQSFHVNFVLGRPPPLRLDKHPRRIQLVHRMIVHIVIDRIGLNIVQLFLFGIHDKWMCKGRETRGEMYEVGAGCAKVGRQGHNLRTEI